MLPAQPSRNELASFWLKLPDRRAKVFTSCRSANYRHPLYAPNFKFRPAFTTSTSVLILIGNAATVLIGQSAPQPKLTPLSSQSTLGDDGAALLAYSTICSTGCFCEPRARRFR